MLSPVPVSRKQANAFVAAKHRHHGPVQGFKFAVGLADASGDLRAVAIAGRPVALKLDDGFTLEVTRLCTDGSKNACSNLYSRIARVARELGYRRVLTYTLKDEPGTSLCAAGWQCTGETPGRSWNVPSRPREDKHQLGPRLRWERAL